MGDARIRSRSSERLALGIPDRQLQVRLLTDKGDQSASRIDLQAGGAYTWGQGFTRPARQDFFNPQSAVGTAADPAADPDLQRHLHGAEGVVLPEVRNMITKDWQVGWFSTYQSGAFLAPPSSPT